ncbi:GUN4 domain-containing protein [Microcoleus sp. ZQ-A2]
MKSILLLAANPKGTKSLRLQEEEREIKERLRLSGYGKIPINSAGAVRPIDIQQAMLDFDPHIVHFSGHGAGQDGLVFEDVIGQEKLVDSEALAELFELFAEQVECVVLNACYSKFQAEAIAQHIDYVIAMSKEIGDNAAIKFSVGFYAALGAGKPFKFAYKLGCNATRLELERSPEYLTPIIWEKGQLIDTRQNNLTSKTQVPNPRGVAPIQEEITADKEPAYESPTPTIPSKPPAKTDDLSSERGVDYTKLRDLLASGKWKEADQETVAVMLKAANREQEGYLQIESIEKFPCTDLRTIDQLWVKYSNGRFGFSVQKRIWESVGGKPGEYDYEILKKFGDRVGWLKWENKWLGLRIKELWVSRYDEFTFHLNAPQGHLPSYEWKLIGTVERRRILLLSRRDL